MNKKFNYFLLSIILVLAVNSIIIPFNQQQLFKVSQQLNEEHDQLISIHKAYLSQYKREYSLLKIEERATNKLMMKLPKPEKL